MYITAIRSYDTRWTWGRWAYATILDIYVYLHLYDYDDIYQNWHIHPFQRDAIYFALNGQIIAV